jgi:PhnB protein
MLVQTYLIFDGRCEEAMEFYRTALGATVEFLMRFKESPVPLPASMVPPGWENNVFHATLRIGETSFGAGDSKHEGRSNFNGFALVLKLPDDDAAERAFAALSEGGQVQLALHKAFFSSRFGIVADRFGITWKIQVVN